MTRPASVEEIAKALGQVSPNAAGYKCRCPSHEDRKASLQINLRGNGDGRPTVYCHAGCGEAKVYRAIEEQTGMHFEARETPSNRTQNKEPSIYPAPIDWYPIRLKTRSPSKSWRYQNADGALMFVVARYDTGQGKEIRPYSVKDVNGNLTWKQGLGGLYPLPLYNLVEVLDRREAPVLIVEGEKAAEAAKSVPELAEFVVTTFQGGAKNWKKTDWSHVKGREIYLWPDNDDAGREQFYELAKSLNVHNFCDTVKIAVIPQDFPDKWDLADKFPDGHGIQSISWADAPRGGIETDLRSVTPANYREMFDSRYWLYHDGHAYFTVEKRWYMHCRGKPFRGLESLVRINSNHPATAATYVGQKAGIAAWAEEKGITDDYLSGFRFRPGTEDMVVVEDGKQYLNTFTGWCYEPDQKGDCSIVKNHILHVVCDGDTRAFNYLWNYLAHIIQHPDQRPTSCIVLKGLQGTGKTKFFDILAQLMGGLGGYAVKLETMSQATDKFNSFLAGALIVWIEELELTTSRERENRLKTMITDPFIRVEAKYRDGYQDRNYARVMGATNHEHVWNVIPGERRLSLFEVSDTRKDDKPYFAALDKELGTASTMRRLMFELVNHPVDMSLVYSPFENKARAQQAMFTMTPSQSIAHQLLIAGEIDLRDLDERREVKTSFYVSQEKWEETGGLLPSKLTNDVITQQIKSGKFTEKGYSDRDKRRVASTVAELMGAARKDDGKFPYTTVRVYHRGGTKPDSAYIIPKLSEARRAFCEQMGVNYADVFEDSTVVPFRKPTTKADDTPF